jgi:hypothetical protein
MNPIRRELLNGLLVLVVASLLSVAFSAFQVSFNPLLWVLILMGIAIAVAGYILFEIMLGVIASAEDREKALAEAMRRREEEWLKRVGNPARLELGLGGAGETPGGRMIVEAVEAMRPGSDLTIMRYVGSGGGRETQATDEVRQQVFRAMMEQVKRGTIREYKRILCFDRDVMAEDHELKSGILHVGQGPGTINRYFAEHCRLMLETKGCSIFVAPVVLRGFLVLFGTDKACLSVETIEQDTGARRVAGTMFFYDPPNGEIIEQFRQIERATERRVVAVHKIRFPEDAEPGAEAATR